MDDKSSIDPESNAGNDDQNPPENTHEERTPSRGKKMSRRQFMVGTGMAGAGAALGPLWARTGYARSEEKPAAKVGSAGADIELTINGAPRRLTIDPRVTLLDALRQHFGLTGTKKGCDHGQCGACTVHVDGRRVNACLTLAVSAAGSKVTTIEGLASGDQLHPMQTAFIEHDGFQCGYCTSGQVMSAVAALSEGHIDSDDAIREQMSGNICRCGAYPGIVAAVKEVGAL